MNRHKSVAIADLFPRQKGRCRKCLTDSPDMWCSARCELDAYNMLMIHRGSSAHIRRALEERDNEICSKCNLDTRQLASVLFWAEMSLNAHGLGQRVRSLLKNTTGYDICAPLWEADHIHEVALGGEHLLSNLQTLCVSCHREKTRAFISTYYRPFQTA